MDSITNEFNHKLFNDGGDDGNGDGDDGDGDCGSDPFSFFPF